MYGFRELTAGIGILTQPRPAGWIWGRVAGDVMDLASLGSAFSYPGTNLTRATAATAAVLGVTALDVVCGQRLSQQPGGGAVDRRARTVIKTIIVDRSPEDAYRFWHDFQNLPKFMTYLESVQAVGDRRTRWVAKGPAGATIQWDAETLIDEPNRVIAWRTIDGAGFQHSGSVRFENAPGNRGTLVRVEMQYSPAGGAIGSAVGKVLGGDLGRRVQHDLRNFKEILEVGEVTQSDASIHRRMHPAQPPGTLEPEMALRS